MSTTYNLEPPPTAKVILHTTSGDLQLELFAKQTPRASRSFLQHCLDGYYDNTIFHRLVPGFIIQGGDPTGTGSGGESAIDNGTGGFDDEVHSRLKFNRRGLLGMAKDEGAGGHGKNGSQFFLTLGEAVRELQGKHTMFGRIEGDTIYNLMKMGDAEMSEGEGSERPLYPTRITGTEVLVNPFDDMLARVKEAPRVREEGGRKEVKKRKKPAGKNVLSFGGGEEGEEEMAAPVLKKVKANPNLLSVGHEEPERMNGTATREPPAKKQRRKRGEEEEPVPEAEDEDKVTAIAAPLSTKQTANHVESDEDDAPAPSAGASALARTNAEIAALKASMKRTVDTAPTEKDRPKSALEAMIPTTSTRGRKRGKAGDERGAIDLFKAFQQRLEHLPPDTQAAASPAVQAPVATNGADSALPSSTAEPAEYDEEAALCDLHFIANCQSCKSWDEDKPDAEAREDGDDDAAWMAHSLSFAKDTLGKDLEWKRKMEEIQVIDPRDKARAIKEEGMRDKRKARG